MCGVSVSHSLTLSLSHIYSSVGGMGGREGELGGKGGREEQGWRVVIVSGE